MTELEKNQKADDYKLAIKEDERSMSEVLEDLKENISGDISSAVFDLDVLVDKAKTKRKDLIKYVEVKQDLTSLI